jgi:cytidylate kinase
VVIAIDGPAGAGKSTVARALAKRLGFTYLDTGAMYRCVGLRSLEQPAEEPASLARTSEIAFAPADEEADGNAQPAGSSVRVLLDGRDVETAIRAPEVSEAASLVAADPGVREALVASQRALVARGDWVAEGRDIATAVAPDAELKVFLTADPAERARRRAAELGGEQATIMAEQALRDERDSTLGRSALAPAPGAVTIDTTGITIERVIDRIAELAAAVRSPGSPR